FVSLPPPRGRVRVGGQKQPRHRQQFSPPTPALPPCGGGRKATDHDNLVSSESLITSPVQAASTARRRIPPSPPRPAAALYAARACRGRRSRAASAPAGRC